MQRKHNRKLCASSSQLFSAKLHEMFNVCVYYNNQYVPFSWFKKLAPDQLNVAVLWSCKQIARRWYKMSAYLYDCQIMYLLCMRVVCWELVIWNANDDLSFVLTCGITYNWKYCANLCELGEASLFCEFNWHRYFGDITADVHAICPPWK